MKISSYLIDKYKGKYQLRAEIDQNTGDYCRDDQGQLDNYSDIWIACEGKGRVFHYGHNILQFYMPSIGRGRNILRAINEVNGNLIFDIEETDEEVLFKFKAANMETIDEYIKPKTFCADRSPFSVKNLPRENKKYAIPTEDLALYKEITASISKDNISVYNIINNGFLTELSTKKRKSIDTFKNEIKMGGWAFKSYIHSLGKDVWINYLDYIKNYLSKI